MMEQKDYLLREIEKIGAIFSLIFSKLSGKEKNQALTIEKQFEDEKGMLLRETGFDMDLFLSLKETGIKEYLSKFARINTANTELLADILKEMGLHTHSSLAKKYLKRALILYVLCNSLDKTYSFQREDKINEIKAAL
jgi:hypothetical protein